MKKRTIYLMIAALSLSTFTPVNATGTDPKTKTTQSTEVSPEMQVMMNRLEEIKSLDKSEMSRAEKKRVTKRGSCYKSRSTILK